ncbi:MAG TPA: hypothetical protein P5527_00580 [Kiritimatiellia bacterium]|nr:hypothetical protein [Kiritimatiellia bacterium]
MSRVSLSSSFSKPFKACSDVTGLELGAGLSEGVPAVRLRKSKGRVEVVAADFLDLPCVLPMSPEESEAQTWRLPAPFRAPCAALAIRSPQASLCHSAGGHGEETADRAVAYRSVSRQTAPEMPPLVASLPDFQAAWAVRLLPEGRRPTACSLQITAAAAMGGFAASSALARAGGYAVALFVFAESTSLAAFQEGRLVFYREHAVGMDHLRSAISSEVGIELELADSALENTLFDPVPIIEPVLRPLYRQVEISADYLLRRCKRQVEHFFVNGLTIGDELWGELFKRVMNRTMTFCSPFDGIGRAGQAVRLPEDVEKRAPLLMTALGAARTVLEDA